MVSFCLSSLHKIKTRFGTNQKFYIVLLNQIQTQLQDRYDLDIPYCIEEFVSSDRFVASQLADVQENEGLERPAIDEEVVFIEQSSDSLEFTVYFDEQLLESVAQARSDLDGVCTVVEGASHAVCLLWHAHNDRQLRPVDLELQAEIDKFVVLMEKITDPAARLGLHRHLFSTSRILPDSNTALYERYKVASSLASDYCQWLNQRFIDDNNQIELHGELSRFYRLSGRAKFDHIQRLH